jgi:hypothetical protein
MLVGNCPPVSMNSFTASYAFGNEMCSPTGMQRQSILMPWLRIAFSNTQLPSVSVGTLSRKPQ